jgi:proteic killer suppression protein
MVFSVEFADPSLQKLETEPAPGGAWSPNIVRSYRKTMNLIRNAVDERDFYNLKGLRYEKLERPREHQHSFRLNKQWRLIVEYPDRPQKTILIVGIEDYH